jgi:hypothetical protein
MTGADRAQIKLTARGAIVLLFVIALLGQTFLPGPAFVAGCLAVVLLVQPRDLLPLVVTPPLVFFAATLLAEAVRSLGAGSLLRTLGLGLFTALSGEAPWLFGGSALVLAVAWFRGLPDNVRELRGESGGAIRASQPAHTPAGTRGRGRRGAAFDPEPEGYFEPRVYGRTGEE